MIYPRATIYNLLIDSIERSVISQLTTQEGQMVAAITMDTLRQLAKYEQREPHTVAALFPLGLALGNEALAVARNIGFEDVESFAAGLSAVQTAREQNANQDPDAAVRTFTQLVGQLDLLAKRLLEASEKISGQALQSRLAACLKDIAEWELQYHESMMAAFALPSLTVNDPPRPLTAAALENRLKSAPGLPADVKVAQFGVISGGMSKETFLVTVEDSVHGRREMVVRKTDLVPLFEFQNSKLSREYALVRRVFELGLPVAEPYWYFPSNQEIDGDLYLMQKMEGRVLGTTFEAFEPLQEELLLNLAAYFAKQHSLPLEQFKEYIRTHDNPVVLTETCQQTIHRFVKDYERMWKEFVRIPSPGEAHTLHWLLNHVPQNSERPVLVHADCTITNFLAMNNKITAVMDWEGAHFGDPAEDLAYVRDIVSKYMDWKTFIAHYRACGGKPIEEKSMNYYQCLSGFKNYSVCNKLNAGLLSGERADVRMLPTGFVYFPKFLQVCIAATRG